MLPQAEEGCQAVWRRASWGSPHCCCCYFLCCNFPSLIQLMSAQHKHAVLMCTNKLLGAEAGHFPDGQVSGPGPAALGSLCFTLPTLPFCSWFSVIANGLHLLPGPHTVPEPACQLLCLSSSLRARGQASLALGSESMGLWAPPDSSPLHLLGPPAAPWAPWTWPTLSSPSTLTCSLRNSTACVLKGSSSPGLLTSALGDPVMCLHLSVTSLVVLSG